MQLTLTNPQNGKAFVVDTCEIASIAAEEFTGCSVITLTSGATLYAYQSPFAIRALRGQH